MRTIISKKIDNPELFKNQLLHWSQQFTEVIFLDSNNYLQKHSSFDFVLAVDAFTSIKTDKSVKRFEKAIKSQSEIVVMKNIINCTTQKMTDYLCYLPHI